jgi:hypothetical protein
MGWLRREVQVDPLRSRRARRLPATVWNRMGSSGAARPSSHKTCAAARVPWPQRLSSTFEENHRRAKPSASCSTKAVAARFISWATSCIQAASVAPGNRQTAAGLPVNGRSAKESTWKIFVRVSVSLERAYPDITGPELARSFARRYAAGQGAFPPERGGTLGGAVHAQLARPGRRGADQERELPHSDVEMRPEQHVQACRHAFDRQIRAALAGSR